MFISFYEIAGVVTLAVKVNILNRCGIFHVTGASREIALKKAFWIVEAKYKEITSTPIPSPYQLSLF